MKSLKYIYALAAITAMTACSSDDELQPDNTPQDYSKVRIDAMVGHSTLFGRSNPAGATATEQSVFNNGDQLVVSDAAATETYTFNGSEWTPSGEGLTYGSFPATYKAFYPAGASMDAFTLPTDQSDAAKIALADYMTTERTIQALPGEGRLILDLERKMSRVVIRVSGVDAVLGGDVTSITVNSGYATVPAAGAATEVKTYRINNNFYALVVPGEAKDNEVFVSVTTASGAVKTVTGINATEAGKSYSYDMYVGESGISISEPIITDWSNGGTLSGEISDVTEEKVDGFFVTVSGAGAKDGSNWENALDSEKFITMISDKSDGSAINGKTFYVAAGEYPFVTSTHTCVPLENSAKTVNTIKGGYAATSTGTDISNRDIKTNKTAFVNNDKAATFVWMFFISANNTITFDGITFDGKFNEGESGYARCFYAANGCILNLNDCVITNFNNVSSGDGGGDGNGCGPVIYANQETYIRMTNVEISNNAAYNRGMIRLNDHAIMFLNNVRFINNRHCGWWGVLIQAGGNNTVCMNNVTTSGNAKTDAGNSALINSDGPVFIANSTIYDDVITNNNFQWMLRCEGQVVNSIVVSARSNALTSADDHVFVSKGYNLLQTDRESTDVNVGRDFNMTYTDGHYELQLPAGFTSFATKAYVQATAKAFVGAERYPSAGADFAAWVGDDFGVDCMGNVRNAAKMMPGSYDHN